MGEPLRVGIVGAGTIISQYSADVALHVLDVMDVMDVMESLAQAARTGQGVGVTSTCERPEPVPGLVDLVRT